MGQAQMCARQRTAEGRNDRRSSDGDPTFGGHVRNEAVSKATAAAKEKETLLESDEEIEEEVEQESGTEGETEGTTKEREKDGRATTADDNRQEASVTYGQQAEQARRAYEQYIHQFGAQLAAHPVPSTAWAYPPPGGAYYPPAYIPVGPDGRPMFPTYYVGAMPPGFGPPIGTPAPLPPDMSLPYPRMRFMPGFKSPLGAEDAATGGEGSRKPVPNKIFIACDYCRVRKLRCSGEKPKCGVCLRAEHDCHYSEIRKTRGPGKKSLMALGVPVTLSKPKKRPAKSKVRAVELTTDASTSPLLAPPFPALPTMPMPMSIPPPESSADNNALTAAAILNALPTLQSPNGQSFATSAPPPIPPPSSPIKQASPRTGKKAKATASPSGEKKRKRGRKA